VAHRVTAVPPERAGELEYDLVVANILARTLIDLAPLLRARLRPGGRLVLCGILEDQAATVGEAYRAGVLLGPAEQEQEWVLLQGVRRSD
jgi:ribosomal protein L11 methyltransferase